MRKGTADRIEGEEMLGWVSSMGMMNTSVGPKARRNCHRRGFIGKPGETMGTVP
jgi:hypothetical protein